MVWIAGEQCRGVPHIDVPVVPGEGEGNSDRGSKVVAGDSTANDGVVGSISFADCS
jgi:hypothetical protein